MDKVLVKCETSEGMFSNEFAVTIESKDGPVSLFAHKDLVQKRNGAFYLTVYLARRDQPEGVVTVLLPEESFEKGTRWVNVPDSSLASL